MVPSRPPSSPGSLLGLRPAQRDRAHRGDLTDRRFACEVRGYHLYVTSTIHLELSLPARAQCVREARQAVSEAVAPLAERERLLDDVLLCVSEAVTNAVLHAYPRGSGRVEIEVESDYDDELLVVVRDTGIGLPPPSRRRAEGYGLKIIDELTRETTISKAPEGGTEIAMVFALDSQAPAQATTQRTAHVG
jgi:stage II sporulation protein AB (anti-sigma F factor)